MLKCQCSNIHLLFSLSCRSLQRDYQRHGRWGKLPTAACVPQVSCTSPSTCFFLSLTDLFDSKGHRTLNTVEKLHVAAHTVCSNLTSSPLKARCNSASVAPYISLGKVVFILLSVDSIKLPIEYSHMSIMTPVFCLLRKCSFLLYHLVRACIRQ